MAEAETVPDAGAETGATTAKTGGSRLLLVGLLAVVLAVVIAVVAVSSDDSPPLVDVQVPAGTAAQLDAGEVVEVVPEILRVEPGGAIELTNDDVRLHVLGALRADAGETARLAFSTEGRYILPTSLRSDGQVTVLVEDPDSGG